MNEYEPHLIIVPLTVSKNWQNEFNKRCPKIKTFLFYGNKDEREILRRRKFKKNKNNCYDFDVIITSYEISMIEIATLKKIAFEYLIIDEAHRIKNIDSKLSKIVRLINSKHRLLLTGTPLQNNMHELWSLLNFLTPNLFDDGNLFTDTFNYSTLSDNKSEVLVNKLHQILRPFMLRRLKKDVAKDLPPKVEICLYNGLTKLQKEWYCKILERNIDAINEKTKRKNRLLNIVMQLRKVCNHPYLFEGVEEGPPFVEGEHLINASGKLIILDKLLKKLQQEGLRVLIFSQMTRVLDILEDYMCLREYEYCRIDGSTNQMDRNEQMEMFNEPNSTIFAFLLSTRAGGLGINLHTASNVILFDSDWNPHMDLQAQDRAHRIGQTKPVHIYRLITTNTIEEKILSRGMKKLYLDAIVIRKGQLTKKQKKMDPNDLKSMITFGAEYILHAKDTDDITEQDINELIKIGMEKTQNLKSKLTKAYDNNIMDFKFDFNDEDKYQTFDGKDYSDINNRYKEIKKFINNKKRTKKTYKYYKL